MTAAIPVCTPTYNMFHQCERVMCLCKIVQECHRIWTLMSLWSCGVRYRRLAPKPIWSYPTIDPGFDQYRLRFCKNCDLIMIICSDLRYAKGPVGPTKLRRRELPKERGAEMHIYVFLCVSMCMYVSRCISMYLYVYLCISMHIYVSLCISMCIYVYLCISMYLYVSRISMAMYV